MNILEESYDSIAPSTQNIEEKDLAEGNKDLHPDFNENYNLSDDIQCRNTISSQTLSH